MRDPEHKRAYEREYHAKDSEVVLAEALAYLRKSLSVAEVKDGK